MTNALLSGLTGLRANQNYLDVIGNNLANSNTPGYKSSRVTFSDILSQTLRPASGPSARLGGTNPLQLGRGAVISSIDQNFAQGSLLTTGRTLDLGVQGNGFFVLSDGNEQFFTRVGAFGLDSEEYLVDLRSGPQGAVELRPDIQITLNSVVPPDGDVEDQLPRQPARARPELGPDDREARERAVHADRSRRRSRTPGSRPVRARTTATSSSSAFDLGRFADDHVHELAVREHRRRDGGRGRGRDQLAAHGRHRVGRPGQQRRDQRELGREPRRASRSRRSPAAPRQSRSARRSARSSRGHSRDARSTPSRATRPTT